MAVDTYALTSLEMCRAYLGWGTDDGTAPAFAIYHDGSNSRTGATVSVLGDTLTFLSTGGSTPPTYTVDLSNASYDTMTEVVTYINTKSSEGWSARQLGPTVATSTDLVDFAATSALLQANELTLMAVDNYMLEKLINGVTYWVEKYCGRKFVSQSHKEYHDGGGAYLFLRNTPVTAVTALAIGSESVFTVKCATADISGAVIDVTSTGLTYQEIGGASPAGATLAFSTYKTLTTLIAALTAISGWTATACAGVEGDTPSTDLKEVYGQNCYDQTLYVEAIAEREEGYAVNPNTGVIYKAGGFGRGFKNIRVDYTAGYTLATGAPDVQDAASRMVALAHKQLQRGSSDLESEKIGDYAYKRATPDKVRAAIAYAGQESIAVWNAYRRAMFA